MAKDKCSKCKSEISISIGFDPAYTYICPNCQFYEDNQFEPQVKQLCKDLADLLIDKRAVYGNNIDNSSELLKILYPAQVLRVKVPG
jgi:hypothetical protein